MRHGRRVSINLHFAEGDTPRQCGGCTLCCKLVPVKELAKGAGERCKHQRHGKGCAVYHRRGMPAACALWNCRWLVNDDTGDLRRPDRAHYVIDLMPDFVTLRDSATGEGNPVEVVQIWVDPGYPDAHRDPALLAYLERRAEEGKAAIIRYDNERAVVVFAPSPGSNRQWNEVESDFRVKEHTLEEVAAALAGAP
jgi:hypothetical protein